MRNIWTIAKREYDHYFASPIAYAVAFTIFLVLGIIFALNIFYYIQNSFQSFGSAPDVGPITGAFTFMLVLSVPALTMRLVSDEHRMGTMELMLTAPVRDSEFIIGKWLGGFLFILTLIVVSLVYPIILNNLVTPGIDQRVMLSAYLGLILISASFLSIGVGVSAVFSNQIASFFVTMIIFVFLWWLVGFPAGMVPVGGNVFSYLDMKTHFYDSLNIGVINLGDLVYYISLTALGLFTGTTAVEMRRWR
jgi:ABC-2 type transport system permease protein